MVTNVTVVSLLGAGKLLTATVTYTTFYVPVSVVDMHYSFQLEHVSFSDAAPPPVTDEVEVRVREPDLPG